MAVKVKNIKPNHLAIVIPNDGIARHLAFNETTPPLAEELIGRNAKIAKLVRTGYIAVIPVSSAPAAAAAPAAPAPEMAEQPEGKERPAAEGSAAEAKEDQPAEAKG